MKDILITAISDTHLKHKQIILPKADILIHAGDWTATGQHNQVRDFLKWVNKLVYTTDKFEYVVLCAGNHDLSIEREPSFRNSVLEEYTNDQVIYLENGSVELNGIKIYGTPWTPEFNNWAFNYKRGSIQAEAIIDNIPRDTDILVTHGPPQGILDQCAYKHPLYPERAGCELLRHHIEEKLNNLKYHIMGHVHENFGYDFNTLPPITFINASICNLQYQPVNKPFLINYSQRKIIDY